MAGKQQTPLYVGTDVGGTNTDCVVLANRAVIARHKAVTSPDITTGIKEATAAALLQAAQTCTNGVVARIVIGTTHFVNAVIERRGLTKVSVIRICGPSSRAVPPFSDFPPDLTQLVKGSVHFINGGYQVMGLETEITALDHTEVRKVADHIHSIGVKNVVIVGVFSPVKVDHEQQVAKLLTEWYPGISVTLSHELGQLGYIQRENAAILNESLKELAERTIAGFEVALNDLGLHCPFYLTQNDGTIISAKKAVKHPIKPFASGPTNSMRGAAFLSDEKNAVVLDIGGTTTDVGMLVDGFPRLSAKRAEVGGVFINQRMIDVFSVGLGGGSLVRRKKDKAGVETVEVGPKSVGYKLDTESLVFGGPTLTATDIAVSRNLTAAHNTQIGDKAMVDHLPDKLTKSAVEKIHSMIEDCVDRIKTSDTDMPLILTGGGSIVVDTANPIRGVSRLVCKKHYDVANAIGAALSQVSGDVDYTVSLRNILGPEKFDAAGADKDKLLEEARDVVVKESIQRANAEAINNGADKNTLEVLFKSDEPMLYMPGGDVIRLRAKVIGDLKSSDSAKGTNLSAILNQLKQNLKVPQESGPERPIVVRTSTPNIDSTTGEWLLSESDVESIALGAAILGSGGGGNNYIGKLMVLNKMREGKRVRVVTPQRYFKDHPHDLAIFDAFAGAPLVAYEKMPAGKESGYAIDAMKQLYNSGRYNDQDGSFKNDKGEYNVVTTDDVVYIENYKPSPSDSGGENDWNINALFCAEVGGLNSMEPLMTGAEYDLPVLDADCMGRAFPQLEMTTTTINGVRPYPLVITTEHGNCDVILWAKDTRAVEAYMRTVCMNRGGAVSLAMRPIGADDVLNRCVQHSMSRAWQIGEAIQSARAHHMDPMDAIFGVETGKVILKGKLQPQIITMKDVKLETADGFNMQGLRHHTWDGRVKDVKLETADGFNRGYVIIHGMDGYAGTVVRLEFQNEYLVAYDVTDDMKLLARVPDLIPVIETETGEAVLTEEICYGLRVTLLSLVCSPLLTTENALQFVGPGAFGYKDVTYKPVAEYRKNEPIPPLD